MNKILQECPILEKVEAESERGNAIKMQSAGLLEYAARFLSQALEGSHLHLDLHAQTSIPVMSIVAMRGDMHAVLVEPNQYLLAASARMSSSIGLHAVTAGTQTYAMRGRDMIRRAYNVEPQDVPDLSMLPPGMIFLRDHVRSARVIQAVLDEREVDSASILFPPKGHTETREAPYTFLPGYSLPMEELQSRASAVQARTFGSAMSVATRYVKPGGKLVLGWFGPATKPEGHGGIMVDVGLHSNEKWVGDLSQTALVIGNCVGYEGQDAHLATLIRTDK